MKRMMLASIIGIFLTTSFAAAEDAETLFNKALESVSKSGANGDTSAAHKYLTAVLQQEPRHLEARWLLFRLKLAGIENLKLPERSTALMAAGPEFTHLIQLAAAANRQAFLHYMTALHAQDYGAYNRASSEIDKALAVEPRSARFARAKGNILAAHGRETKNDADIERGVGWLKQARELSKARANRFAREASYDFDIAWALEALSQPRWPEVIEHYRRYIEHSAPSGSTAYAWNNVSIAYRKLGQCGKAKEAAEKALQIARFGAAESNKTYAEFCLQTENLGRSPKKVEPIAARG